MCYNIMLYVQYLYTNIIIIIIIHVVYSNDEWMLTRIWNSEQNCIHTYNNVRTDNIHTYVHT